MAKKQRNNAEFIDSIALALYRSGSLHSCIINCAILIVLALIFPETIVKKPITISLSFASSQEMIEPDIKPFDSIPEDIKKDNTIESSNISSNDDVHTSVFTPKEEQVSIDPTDTLFIENELPDGIVEEIGDISDLLTEVKMPRPARAKTVRTTRRITESPNPGNSNDPFAGTMDANTGTEGEIERRLVQYGAKTGDVQISLSWNTIDDIDLHVMVVQGNSYINWTNRLGRCGGCLDIDMNAHPSVQSNRPVENIFWPHGASPYGEFIIGVQHYYPWGRNRSVSGTLLVKIDGKTKTYPFIATHGSGVQKITTVTRNKPK